MSPADSADRPAPLRVTYSAELEQLRLQVEVMGVLVDQNLERMRQVLETGDPTLASHALGADDDIDAMICATSKLSGEEISRSWSTPARTTRSERSPMRSSSLLTRMTDTTRRRSEAMGFSRPRTS
jgi:hypothetical protein